MGQDSQIKLINLWWIKRICIFVHEPYTIYQHRHSQLSILLQVTDLLLVRGITLSANVLCSVTVLYHVSRPSVRHS
jgi:hypothetical protein